MQPQLQLVERQALWPHHDELAVGNERASAPTGHELHDLGEVPAHRAIAAALELDLAVLAHRDDRAEPVPLRLVRPTLALRDLGLELREHRPDPAPRHAASERTAAAHSMTSAAGR